MFLDSRVSKNILQFREAKVSKFMFMHTLSESKSIFAVEQKAIVLCFVKDVAFLLGHLVEKVSVARRYPLRTFCYIQVSS